MLDPSDNFTQPAPMPRLAGLLEEWGITATDSVIVDFSGLTRVATLPVAAPPYPNHPITERFDLITMFPLARAIVPATGGAEGRTPQPFVQTAPRTWAEADLATLENTDALAPEPEKGDTAGPVTVAMAVAVPSTAPEAAAAEQQEGEPIRSPETRVAVFGDSDFAANQYLGIEGNGDLFMNTVNWLAQQESLIAIRPKEAADRRLTMTANHITGLFWLSIVLVPAIVLGSGIYTWWRRR
jgi:ABC-type uncharacterized transport system involved in gliding motility auxiliary subunit